MLARLRKHIDGVRQFLIDNPFYDIFGVAETCFGPQLDDSVVNISRATRSSDRTVIRREVV